MKKLMIAALAVAMFATPAMAGGDRRPEPDPAVKEAEHAAKEAIKDAARCNKALEEYLKDGTNYAAVVFWCGL